MATWRIKTEKRSPRTGRSSGTVTTRRRLPATTCPHEFPERILLMTLGGSPAVVTETLYFLTVCESPPFVPTAIHLVSTSEGLKQARAALLPASAENPGGQDRIGCLVRDYDLPLKDYATITRLHPICDGRGRPLKDIGTEAENEATANSIVALFAQLTERHPNGAIHASVAGGRKTMSVYISHAMTLLGRPQDRLSHVLVNPPYENDRTFFYPQPAGLGTRPQAEPVVRLADVPVVRLREQLPLEALAKGKLRYSDLVAAAQKTIGPPSVQIDLDQATLLCGGRQVDLGPQLLAIYSLLCSLAKDGRLLQLDSSGPRLPPEFGDVIRRVRFAKTGKLASAAARSGPMTAGSFLTYLSKINSAIEKVFLTRDKAAPYLIHTEVRGRGKPTQYSVRLMPEQIAIEPWPPPPIQNNPFLQLCSARPGRR